MRSDGTGRILNWVLLISTLALLVCVFKYYNKSKTVRQYQVLIGQFSGLQNNEQLIRSLVAESLEYAKTNPSINPVLETIVGKPGAAAKPAAAPATR
ncbi:MAG TPA: hypothetical protein PKN95_07050 [Verrucomicrobiota bacterium]|nr:hypothetical protein [Verrucomicrobiota bacterium]HNT13420.1 hypothetical protein [Verrucomicrobiota bacterium]